MLFGYIRLKNFAIIVILIPRAIITVRSTILFTIKPKYHWNVFFSFLDLRIFEMPIMLNIQASIIGAPINRRVLDSSKDVSSCQLENAIISIQRTAIPILNEICE